MEIHLWIIIALVTAGYFLQAGIDDQSLKNRACIRLLEIAIITGSAVLLMPMVEAYPLWVQAASFIALVYAFYLVGIIGAGHTNEKTRSSIGSALNGPLRFLSVFSLFLKTRPAENDTLSSDELREMLAEVPQDVVDEPQKELIENVFDMDDTSIDEICTHRSQVVSLSLSQTPEKWAQIIRDNRHTFYPILGKDEDDVMGVLDTRDYFRLKKPNRDGILQECVDKPLFVAENMKADDLFKEMQEKKTYFAIVLDEYGGLTGIVTLHDIIETLFGRMREADDAMPAEIRKLSDGTWEIYGSADLADVAEALDIALPEDEYDTFGGYVLGEYGFIPDDGTQLEIRLPELDVQIFDIKKHRIGRMRVKKRSG